MQSIVARFWARFGQEEQELLDVYHFARVPRDQMVAGIGPDTFLVDPNMFSEGQSYSKNDRELSDVPRSFFYTDLGEAEPIVKSGNLYSAQVDPREIYDLQKDPEGFKEQVRHPVYGLRKGEEWSDLLNAIKAKYKGVRYRPGRFEVVALFEPIEARRLEQ